MSDKMFENNQVTVVGEIASDFQFSHEVFGEGFYFSELAVKRTSGFTDYIPIVVSERLMDAKEKWIGQYVKIEGQFRSFNLHQEGKNKLVLQVFAREVEVLDVLCPESEIFLNGYICKEPVYRKTPRGREIADVLVAVNRSYGKSDYIPCILWGRNARFASTLEVGDHVKVWGRIQSRDYVKKYPDAKEGELLEEVRTAYEVSVSKIEV